MFNLYDLFLIAATNKLIQPTIKLKPPNGVIGPNTAGFPTSVIERTLNTYRDPEKRIIPIAKAKKATRIAVFLALENVERNNRAKV